MACVRPVSTGLAPRVYQEELLDSAKAGNLIAHLPTGTGKTWVGAQLILHYARECGKTADRPSRVGVFLVPKVPLVLQQAEALQMQTGLRVGSFCSVGRVDMWSAERWKAALSVKDVAVCTPQTLLDALRHGLVHMEDFPVLVFDECHHVVGNDAYNCLMREFYAVWDPATQGAVRPRILGLTASPLKRVADSTHTPERCAAALADVERTYHAPLSGLSPRAADAVNAVAVRPDEVTVPYVPSDMALSQAALAGSGGDGDVGVVAMKDAEDLLAGYAAFLFLDRVGTADDVGGSPPRLRAVGDPSYRSAANRTVAYVVGVLGRVAGQLWADHLGVPAATKPYTAEPDMTPKAHAVLSALTAEFDRLAAPASVAAGDAGTRPIGVLVFVARRVTAWALAALLTAIATPADARIRAGFVVGHRSSNVNSATMSPDMSAAAQRRTLSDLRTGQLSTVVATAVLAEGVDVPHVGAVLLTDGASSPLAYVQARGRARDWRARLVWLVPTIEYSSVEGLPGRTVATSIALALQGAAMMEQVAAAKERQKRVELGGSAAASGGGGPSAGVGAAHVDMGVDGPDGDRMTGDIGLDGPPPPPTPTVFSTTTRARVNVHSALSLLSRYTTSLLSVAAAEAGCKPPKPVWVVEPVDPTAPRSQPPFKATVTLPHGAAVRDGHCVTARTTKEAKQLAALDACRQLYEVGALNGWMLPQDGHLEGRLPWHREELLSFAAKPLAVSPAAAVQTLSTASRLGVSPSSWFTPGGVPRVDRRGQLVVGEW